MACDITALCAWLRQRAAAAILPVRFSVTRRCCIILREFFTTAEEGSSEQEPPSLVGQYTLHTWWCKGRRWVTTSERAQEDTRMADAHGTSDHECANARVTSQTSSQTSNCGRSQCVLTMWNVRSPLRWDLHPPLRPPFQLPEVTPPALASRSIPPARPSWDYAAPAPQREDKSA